MTDDKYNYNGEIDLDKTDKMANKMIFNGEYDDSDAIHEHFHEDYPDGGGF